MPEKIRFIIFLENTSIRLRFLITVTFLLSLFVFTYFFLYKPIILDIEQNQCFLKDFIDKKNLSIKVYKDIENLNLKYKKLLENYNSLKGKSMKFSDNVNAIFKLLREEDIKCLEFKSENIKSNINYEKHYYNLKLEGEFKQLINFLQKIKKDSFYKFKKITIEAEQDKIIFDSKIRLIKI